MLNTHLASRYFESKGNRVGVFKELHSILPNYTFIHISFIITFTLGKISKGM